MSITHQAVRTKSFQSLPIDAPTPLRERVGVISSVASTFPESAYSQEEVGALLGLENKVVRKLLRAPHIQKRHLYLPEGRPHGAGRARNPQRTCTPSFREGALEIGSRAIRTALDAVSLSEADVDYIMCVTSTGFMVPGLSSLFTA